MIDITNIIVRSITTESFTIEWDSTQGGTSQIIGNGIVSNEELFSYFHITKVTGLNSGQTYNFIIRTKDRNNTVYDSQSLNVKLRTPTELSQAISQFRIANNQPNAVPQQYYVSTTGNDSNPGTYELPWQTLVYATTKVYAGDIINVMSGNWYNQQTAVMLRSGADFAPITIKAYDPNNRPIFTSSSYQPNSLIATSNTSNSNEGTRNYNIAYWNIDGIIAKHHWRPFFLSNHANHINIINCDGDSNSSTIFIYNDSHHIITQNINITKGMWNDWFCQNSGETITGNHHILADNVTSTLQGFYSTYPPQQSRPVHSCFDIHAENDGTGVNQSYITLWNCSALDIGTTYPDYNACPIFIHGYGTGMTHRVAIINWTVRNFYRAVLDISPGEAFYCDGINANNTAGINIVGIGKDVVIKNVNINMRNSSELFNYGSGKYGFYIWAGNYKPSPLPPIYNGIDGMLLKNISISNVDSSLLYHNGTPLITPNLEIINSFGEDTCPIPQFNFIITQV